jgi:hypothetical protein
MLLPPAKGKVGMRVNADPFGYWPLKIPCVKDRTPHQGAVQKEKMAEWWLEMLKKS